MSEASEDDPVPFVWNKQEVTYQAFCAARRDAGRKILTVISVCVVLLVATLVLPLGLSILDIALITGGGTVLVHFGSNAVFPHASDWGKPLFKKAEAHFASFEQRSKANKVE